jgi:hypothetical protein
VSQDHKAAHVTVAKPGAAACADAASVRRARTSTPGFGLALVIDDRLRLVTHDGARAKQPMKKVEILAGRPSCADSEPFVEAANAAPPLSADSHVGPCPYQPRKLASSIFSCLS